MKANAQSPKATRYALAEEDRAQINKTASHEETISTDKYVIVWWVEDGMKKQPTYHARVFDRATKAQVFQGTLDLGMAGSWRLNAMVINGQFVLLFGQITGSPISIAEAYARKFDLPSMQSDGPPIQMARYERPQKRAGENQLLPSLKASPNKKKWALILYGGTAGKDLVEYGCWVLNADLSPDWDSRFQVQERSTTLEIEKYVLTDDGKVYATILHKKSIAELTYIPDTDHAIELFEVRKDGWDHAEVELGADNAALSADMVADGDSVHVGGFTQGAKKNGVFNGAFLWTVGMGLKAGSSPKQAALVNEEKDWIFSCSFHSSASGFRLLGRCQKYDLVFVAMDKGGKRTGYSRMEFADLQYTMHARMEGEDLVLAYYDEPRNIDNINNGKSFNTGVTDLSMEPVFCVISPTGKAHAQAMLPEKEGMRRFPLHDASNPKVWQETGVFTDIIYNDQPQLVVIERQ